MLSPEGVECGLHVLYITDICHAGVSNSNPCETFLPSDQAQQRQEVQKEASAVLTLVCVDLHSQKVRAEVGSRMQAFQLLNQNSNVSGFIFLPFIH